MLIVALMCLLLTKPVSAQDWQYDEDNDLYHNCDLVASVKEAFGADNLMRFPDGNYMTMAYFLDRVFASCAVMNRAESVGEFNDSAAEPETELAVIAVLDDHETHSIDAADCSVSARDRFDEDLNVSLAGVNQESMSVDVYLPGASEPLDMPHVNSYETEVYGVALPVRTEWALGRYFPLGRYTFDLHIHDQSYRFQWLRRDEAVNTIVVACLDPTSEEATENGILAELEDGEIYSFLASDCTLETSDFAGEVDLKLLVSADDMDSVEVRLFYPGELSAIELDNVTNMVEESGTPYRVEFVKGETFPTGVYVIEVLMNDELYRFNWNRQDDGFKTVAFICTR